MNIAHDFEILLSLCCNKPAVRRPFWLHKPLILQKKWVVAVRRHRGGVGVPMGIRTPVTAVKGRCPRPLDDGDGLETNGGGKLVELGGIEPPTSCMPCKRSPS